MDAKQRYLSEAEAPFTPLTAAEEAARCLLCHDAPCSKGCPAGTDPGKFIRSIRFMNYKGAAETIRENNILGGICARVCPYDKLCELECSRTGIDKPIEIGKLQRFATDFEKITGFQVLDPVAANKEKVAVIGSGPAGLAVAASLALKGYKVSVFEEKAKFGGWLAYGIPPARLPENVVENELEYVKKLGVEFIANCKVGKDVTLDELKAKDYKAFFVGMGTTKAKEFAIPGCDLQGYATAVDFLSTARSQQGNIAIGTDVVIVGGGDVAMDCATTAKLLGARNVNLVCIETQDIMPADIDEKKYVHSLNINIFAGYKPVEITGNNGKVTGFKAVGLDVKSSSEFTEVPETQLQLKADMVIFAIGQKADDAKAMADLAINHAGLVLVDENTGATNIKGIFAAGDIVNGGKTVVEAVARGKVAADSIEKYLATKKEGVK